MKIKRANMAVSEIIGTLNLLGIAVGLFSILYISVLSISPPPTTPPVDIVAMLNGDDIILEHHGGEIVNLDTVVYITCNNNNEEFIVRDYLDDKIENKKWDISERLVYTSSIISDDFPVYISVVDKGSNSIIMTGVFQEKTAG